MKKKNCFQIDDEAGYDHALRSIDELIVPGFDVEPSKQKEFLKKSHDVLNIDAAFLLEHK